MRTIAGLPMEINKLPDLNRVVDMCGSFFTVRENHVYFIHQSAGDYLATYQAKTVLKSSQEDVHYIIFQRSFVSSVGYPAEEHLSTRKSRSTDAEPMGR